MKTVVTAEVSDQLFEALHPLQETYALIAFRQTVEGLLPEFCRLTND